MTITTPSPLRAALRAAGLAAILAAGPAGCGAPRATALPFTGTWYLAQAAPGAATTPGDGDAQGWLAISPEQVIGDVAGLPRGILAVRAAAADPARGSACLDLDGGVRLYLAAGHGAGEYLVPGGRVLGPADWLDVHAVARRGSDEQELARLRLWTSASLTTAATAAHLRPTPLPAVAPAPAPATPPPAPAPSRPPESPVATASLPAELRLQLLHLLEDAQRGEPAALVQARAIELRLAAAEQGR